MAQMVIKTPKIIKNIKKLNTYLSNNNIKWSLITKVLSGNKKILKIILSDPSIKNIISIGDSRLTNLKNIKQIHPDIVTMYIKPPALKYVKSVINYSDISFNTSYDTIKALNEEAKRKKKMHKIIIMIEMGELREGILRDKIIEFYQKIFSLDNIEIMGLGTNLGCMYGVEPTYDKLMQLCLYKKILELKFNKKLDLISGGSSITLPMIKKKRIPIELNHLRIGEAAFLGTTPLDNKKFANLSTDTFEYKGNIIELEKKASKPDGVIGEGNVGETKSIEKVQKYKESYRAILDFGLLDVDVKNITPKDKTVKFVGTTSDMTVYDLGDNKKNGKTKYKVGSIISFKPNYMAVATLMNSKFINKKII